MAASKRLHINYSSAKTIMNTYKKHGRIHKKLTRDRRPSQLKASTTSRPQELNSNREDLESALPSVRLPSLQLPQSLEWREDNQSSDRDKEKDEDEDWGSAKEQTPLFDFASYTNAIVPSFAKRLAAEVRELQIKIGYLALPAPETLCCSTSNLKSRSPYGSALSASS